MPRGCLLVCSRRCSWRPTCVSTASHRLQLHVRHQESTGPQVAEPPPGSQSESRHLLKLLTSQEGPGTLPPKTGQQGPSSVVPKRAISPSKETNEGGSSICVGKRGHVKGGSHQFSGNKKDGVHLPTSQDPAALFP